MKDLSTFTKKSQRKLHVLSVDANRANPEVDEKLLVICQNTKEAAMDFAATSSTQGLKIIYYEFKISRHYQGIKDMKVGRYRTYH